MCCRQLLVLLGPIAGVFRHCITTLRSHCKAVQGLIRFGQAGQHCCPAFHHPASRATLLLAECMLICPLLQSDLCISPSPQLAMLADSGMHAGRPSRVLLTWTVSCCTAPSWACRP